MDHGVLIIVVSRSHSDTPHSVGFLWISDQPDTETSTWQHTKHYEEATTPPRGFEPTVPVSEQPKVHDLECTATGIGNTNTNNNNNNNNNVIYMMSSISRFWSSEILQKHADAYLFMIYFRTLPTPHYSPPSNAQVKNERSYNSASPISLHGIQKANFIPVTSSSDDSELNDYLAINWTCCRR